MFDKVLIANRGEIALRIIRACRELGVSTVAVHSEVDENALHVRFADEAVCIGPAPSTASYLHVPAIIAAAEVTNANAIHPGYGFLAENAEFAEICAQCGLTFIGPRPEDMRQWGDKVQARELATKLGLPLMTGTGVLENADHAASEAERVGFPVMLKASGGGGGRGMQIIRTAADMRKAFPRAKAEALAAFKNGDLYCERYVEEPRHIEFQVLGDDHGNLVHLFERECSIQRRHQKLLEECPSTALDDDLRSRMAAMAVKAAGAVSYRNAGTVEFLLDSRGEFYFIEMNTRIQVEHPVTEMVTGIDLIKEQIRVAAGEPLAFTQDEVRASGHAIECRINAEDPETFLPSPGKITTFHPPGGPGVRLDTACYAEAVVPPYYDSMIAKLIARGNTRGEAILRMRRALDSFVVEGIKTNLPLQQKILSEEDFVRGRISTRLMERFMEPQVKPVPR